MDVHNSGIVQQHRLIRELDTAVATLMDDLQQKRLLEKTLIMITTEFGRPPEFDSGGGRGHQGSAFTSVIAGGGLSHVVLTVRRMSFQRKLWINRCPFPTSLPPSVRLCRLTTTRTCMTETVLFRSRIRGAITDLLS